MRDVVEPGQRYWRRRANRKVRKRRLARNAARHAGALAVQIAIAVVLLYGAVEGCKRLTHSQLFALRAVELRGVERADGDAILADLAAFAGHNLFELELDGLTEIVERDPWVGEVSLRRLLPDTLRIQVVERTPSAIALIDGVPHVVDSVGRVVGPVGPRIVGDLPVLTGVEATNAVTLCLDLARGVEMLARLRQASPLFVLAISELDLSERDRVRVRTVDPGPTLLLDPDRVERNVARWLDLRGQIAQQVGSSEYVDLRWQGRIAVMPLMRDRS